MPKSFSIAEARHDLAALVHELEKKSVIELTRRGKPVALLISLREYRRLRATATNFWDSYSQFRERANLRALHIEPNVWQGVRDTSRGREVEF
jgi:antitoxin Phd